VLLKYTPSVFFSGGIYQDPQRSLATSGSWYASATEFTNSLSEMIDVRRLCIDSVERLSDDNVLEKFGLLARCGKRMSASDNGWVISKDGDVWM
jgi:hypothetical protein